MNPFKHEPRERFPYGQFIPTRWGDVDLYGHVNNVVYYSWFDTLIGRLLVERRVIWPHGGPSVAYCVSSGCDFFEPVLFPQAVEARLRIGRVGQSSLRYEIGLFLEGRRDPVAAGHFAHVFVDQATRRPAPLTAVQRQALADLGAPEPQNK